jgi:hypothetical protein
MSGAMKGQSFGKSAGGNHLQSSLGRLSKLSIFETFFSC